jgi:hypothetical protein
MHDIDIAERLQQKQHEHHRRHARLEPITKLLRRRESLGTEIVKALEEYEAHTDSYGDGQHDARTHAHAMRAIDRANDAMRKHTEIFKALLEQPKEALLEHEGFLAFRERCLSRSRR